MSHLLVDMCIFFLKCSLNAKSYLVSFFSYIFVCFLNQRENLTQINTVEYWIPRQRNLAQDPSPARYFSFHKKIFPALAGAFVEMFACHSLLTAGCGAST